MRSQHIRRAALGLVLAAVTIGAYACGATGHVRTKGKVPVPFMDDIRWEIVVGNDGSTIELQGGKDHANKCVEITWSDSTGAEISSEILETDGSGAASGQVPSAAVRWEAKLVECPDSDSKEPQQPPPYREARELRTYVVWGTPIIPSDDAGATNLTYAFLVRASSFEQVEALTQPIVQGGIGSPVPPAVTVLTFATLEKGANGGLLVQAQPGVFGQWSIDFNEGAHHADLDTNSIRYQLGGWDVVETTIPMGAFDHGSMPGHTYSNGGVSTYRTNLMPEVAVAEHRFEYSN